MTKGQRKAIKRVYDTSKAINALATKLAEWDEMRKEQKAQLLPFLEIAKDENLTNLEKIEKLYFLSESKFFAYGKKRNIKGGDLIFQIVEYVLPGEENAPFNALRKVYFNITKNKAFEF